VLNGSCLRRISSTGWEGRVGHKTESIYRRYAIVARQDLVDGLKRLADYRAGLDKTPAEQKVVTITSAAV
jgi:hypothetical protein